MKKVKPIDLVPGNLYWIKIMGFLNKILFFIDSKGRICQADITSNPIMLIEVLDSNYSGNIYNASIKILIGNVIGITHTNDLRFFEATEIDE